MPALFDRLEAAILNALRRVFASEAAGRDRREALRPREPWPAPDHPALFISEWK
jgi:hypothetical protein